MSVASEIKKRYRPPRVVVHPDPDGSPHRPDDPSCACGHCCVWTYRSIVQRWEVCEQLMAIALAEERQAAIHGRLVNDGR